MPHEPTQTLGVAVWTQCGPVPTTSVMATKQRQIYVLDDDGSNTTLVAYPLIEETPDFYVVQTIGVKGKKGRKRLAKVADDVFGTALTTFDAGDMGTFHALALMRHTLWTRHKPSGRESSNTQASARKHKKSVRIAIFFLPPIFENPKPTFF